MTEQPAVVVDHGRIVGVLVGVDLTGRYPITALFRPEAVFASLAG